MGRGVLISVATHRHRGIKVQITRGVHIDEARLINKDLVVLPRIIVEEGDLKEIVRWAMGLHLPLYTFNNRNAKQLLSSIRALHPSDLDM